jgi:polar amino acid transport system substrate-binding protein
MSMARSLIIWCLWVFLVCASFATASPRQVSVGAYDFPPFSTWSNGQPAGIVTDLLALLNQRQKRFQFTLVETSPKRRYEDMSKKIYDVIFFEDKRWGWSDPSVEASRVFMVGGEVFITRAIKGRDQRYFDDLKGKSIRGILGYHYGFANYRTDPAELSRWNLMLTNSHEGNIRAILDGRSDMAIVTKEYLDGFFAKNPRIRTKLLVSKRVDQEYRHTALVRKDSAIALREINHLLEDLLGSGELEKLLNRLGLRDALPAAGQIR